MLKRKALCKLVEWKRQRKENNNKCLLVSGARQVGKSYIVERFGEEYYDSFIEINFYEHPEMIEIFNGSYDSKTIISTIKLYKTDARIVDGNTLIFLDEIQECPNAITALKFLASDKRFDTIASGSLLGINYKGTKSYPVGYIEYLDMYSLDFEEFLWAMDVEKDIIDMLKEHFESKVKVPHAINEKILEYLRMYMVVGGMPEIVSDFVQNRDYYTVDKMQRRIFRDYLADIARYAEPSLKIKAEQCYKSIPIQLCKENHKFQYSIVEHKGTSRKFGNSLDWIINANMAFRICNLSHIEYPLESKRIDDNIRVYMTDIGLYVSTFDYSLKRAVLQDKNIEDSSVSNIVLKASKGGLYEALVLDMLIKNGHKEIFFYKNEQGTVEMEFLIENSDGIVPIEVKAGRTGTKSLNTILKNENVSYGYKLSNQNIGVSDKKITLPLYMAMFM